MARFPTNPNALKFLHRIGGLPKKPHRIPKRLPRQIPPKLIGMSYGQALVPVCDLAKRCLDEVRPEIMRLLGDARCEMGLEMVEHNGRIDQADNPYQGCYADLLIACEEMAIGGVTLSTYGETEIGPQVVLDLPGTPTMVVVTGQHGEERAGPALFLDRGKALFEMARMRGLGLRCYPCVNPEGYERDTRRDVQGDIHANSFLEFEREPGKWVDELAPGDVCISTRRAQLQAPETKAFCDDLEAFAENHEIRAVLDLHEDSILPPGYAFAYVGSGHHALYASILRNSALPLSNVHLENESWSNVELRTDDAGLVEDFCDGSVTDWAEEVGIPHTICIETPVHAPYSMAVSCYLIWIEAIMQAVTSGHMDAGESQKENARSLIAQAARKFTEVFAPTALEEVIKNFAQQTTDFQRAQLDKQVRAAVGVDVKTFLEPLGEGALEGFVQRNVNLIVTVPERYFARLQGDTENAFLTGRHPNDLARDLEERYEMSQRDAMRIARDQTGKLYNQVNRERQQQLGVTEFIWRTSGTNLVCDDCGSMEGERCSYENPPDIGLPGESHIMCMCYEEPVLDDLLGDIGMDLGEESSAEAPVAEEVTPDEEQGDEGQGM